MKFYYIVSMLTISVLAGQEVGGKMAKTPNKSPGVYDSLINKIYGSITLNEILNSSNNITLPNSNFVIDRNSIDTFTLLLQTSASALSENGVRAFRENGKDVNKLISKVAADTTKTKPTKIDEMFLNFRKALDENPRMTKDIVSLANFFEDSIDGEPTKLFVEYLKEMNKTNDEATYAIVYNLGELQQKYNLLPELAYDRIVKGVTDKPTN